MKRALSCVARGAGAGAGADADVPLLRVELCCSFHLISTWTLKMARWPRPDLASPPSTRRLRTAVLDIDRFWSSALWRAPREGCITQPATRSALVNIPCSGRPQSDQVWQWGLLAQSQQFQFPILPNSPSADPVGQVAFCRVSRRCTGPNLCQHPVANIAGVGIRPVPCISGGGLDFCPIQRDSTVHVVFYFLAGARIRCSVDALHAADGQARSRRRAGKGRGLHADDGR